MRQFDFVRSHKVYFVISAVAVLASIVLLFTMGLNWGIDFEGGTLLERAVPGQVTVGEIQDVLAGPDLAQFGFGSSFVQPLETESPDETVFLIRTRAVTDSDPIRFVDEALSERFGDVTVRRTELVGPVIGQELRRQAVWALLLSAAGILAYISFRFEYRSGVITVVTLLHDVLLVLGILALLRVEVNTSFIAAILTVAGYSINDTIVIFDRIREHMSLRKKESLASLVNASINETLTRSINTGLTTLFVVAAMYLFGGSTIKDFTLTLLVGIVAGAYSSIFVASPLWLDWRQSQEGSPKRTKVA